MQCSYLLCRTRALFPARVATSAGSEQAFSHKDRAACRRSYERQATAGGGKVRAERGTVGGVPGAAVHRLAEHAARGCR
jgi:hypothetical protein